MSKTYLDLFMEKHCKHSSAFDCEDIKAFLEEKGITLIGGNCTNQDPHSSYWCEDCLDRMRDLLKQEVKEPLLSKEDYELLKEFSALSDIHCDVTEAFVRDDDITILLIKSNGNELKEDNKPICREVWIKLVLTGSRFCKLKTAEDYNVKDLLKRGYYEEQSNDLKKEEIKDVD